MPKFLAATILDLMTAERGAGRIARKAKIVVCVEADDGSWCELDADSEAHARVLAQNWVQTLGARGCSCWHVRQQSGRLAPSSFYSYFNQPEDCYHG